MRKKLCKLFSVILALLLLAGCAGNAQPDPTATQAPATTQATSGSNAQHAPNFTVLDSQGKQVQLSDYLGTPVVLNFWATWCPYCTQEMPDFEAAAKATPDVQFMMVNATDGAQETTQKAAAFIRQEGYTFDVFYDTQLSAIYTFGITALPCTFFIDAQGNILASQRGAVSAQQLAEGIALIQK